MESGGPTSADDILIYDVAARSVSPFLADRTVNESTPEFSPDGRWLAYVSDETRGPEVYVTSFPTRDRKVLVSTRGGREPAWSKGGRRL